ncbi:Cystatin domain containing protein [Parasponia andersonii]|uniref:Cystatin domain containing protein n=1 Tax=Parasponia andersonii TaxID=3476 RepID=A0A2P5AIG6_PARAD|nr:Cystatin domain containing protein [Parasponia andersonii]
MPKETKLSPRMSAGIRKFMEIATFSTLPEVDRSSPLVRRNMTIYRENVRRTEGFYIGENLGRLPIIAGIGHMDPDDEDAISGAKAAVEAHNARTGQNVELKRIVRVNAQAVAGEVLYITLEASDDCFYESKVYITNADEPTDPDVVEVDFCRPAVHYQA